MLAIRSRQRVRRINNRQFKLIITAVLAELEISPDSEICFHLIAAPEMARLNWQFLQHEGSTDVITFNHAEGTPPAGKSTAGQLHGEIFICLNHAVAQARRFRTTWQDETVRYAVHGLLHLLGHDDLRSAARARMKREENRLVRQIAKQFPLTGLSR